MEKKEVLIKVEVHVPKNVSEKNLLAYILRNWDNRCIINVKGIK